MRSTVPPGSRRLRRLALSCLTSCALSGCATTDDRVQLPGDPASPDSASAVIHVDPNLGIRQVTLSSGRVWQRGSPDAAGRRIKVIETSPGTVRMTVDFATPCTRSRQPATISARLDAGGTYRLDANVDTGDRTWRPAVTPYDDRPLPASLPAGFVWRCMVDRPILDIREQRPAGSDAGEATG